MVNDINYYENYWDNIQYLPPNDIQLEEMTFVEIEEECDEYNFGTHEYQMIEILSRHPNIPRKKMIFKCFYAGIEYISDETKRRSKRSHC